MIRVMILRQFPNVARTRPQDRRVFASFWRQNVISQAKTTEIAYAVHTAPLSIKSTLKGREVYEVDGYPIAVDEGTYLILNDGQPYASYISSDEEVESFCLFFRAELARQVSAAFTSAIQTLLDNPQPEARCPQPCFPHLRRRDALISPLLDGLCRGIAAGQTEELWLDEKFHALMEAMLRLHRQISREIDQLPALRRATREELYRRLHRAKDYLEACYAEPLTIPELARVACLSEHHFLRLFKQAFHVTPHQHLTVRRLQHARALLTGRDRSVTEVCLQVGFENASSFTRLFKQRFGITPQRLRRGHS
jgi:AraC family transcriptional regulator